jgi:(p)ppGpp synthase/HD superfamily hydrolase
MIRVLRAFKLAWWGHRNQRDKGGRPYIWHLVRVAWIAYGITGDLEAAVVGLLHDYYEDVDWTPKVVLRFGVETEMRVWRLTRPMVGESYDSYIRHIQLSQDPITVSVKIADLLDNTRSGRLPRCKDAIEEQDNTSRMYRYSRALQVLLQTRLWMNGASWRYDSKAKADQAQPHPAPAHNPQ